MTRPAPHLRIFIRFEIVFRVAVSRVVNVHSPADAHTLRRHLKRALTDPGDPDRLIDAVLVRDKLQRESVVRCHVGRKRNGIAATRLLSERVAEKQVDAILAFEGNTQVGPGEFIARSSEILSWLLQMLVEIADQLRDFGRTRPDDDCFRFSRPCGGCRVWTR